MSGGEVAGLAIGVVALASLFTTCIDCFDYYEICRDYVSDHDIACTKYHLLRERLRTWGTALRVTEPGLEDPALREGWPAKCEIVQRSLLGLQTSLRESEALLLRSAPTPRIRYAQSGHSRGNGSLSKLPLASSNLYKRSRWTISGSRKIESLLRDLAFFIENLEKVVEHRRMETVSNGAETLVGPGRRENHIVQRFKSSRMTRIEETKTIMSHGRMEEQADVEEADNGSSSDGEQSTRRRARSDGPLPKQSARFTFEGGQEISGTATAVQGNIGVGGSTVFKFKDKQTIKDKSLLIQGTMSEAALAMLQGVKQCSEKQSPSEGKEHR